MRTEAARPVHLADYRPSDYLIDEVHLDVSLALTSTRIRAELQMRPNPAGRAGAPLTLDGDELQLVAVALDGVALDPATIATPDRLTIGAPPQQPFRLLIETLVNPSANTKLMGLYRSGSAYCTQCEAEGFRRITYFLDRPDVLSVYTTRIEADKSEAPVLLGNGNPAEAGEIEGTTRHFAVWHDPHPKPCYLFALVGGNLGVLKDTLTTMSGRTVDLGIYVEHGREARAAYAIDALKRSMKWDEHAFGREYDLDVFNIVAVSDFNMGAMENKGLNIFNDKYVLASPETATDADYAHIEAVIAHEYFHNWTGNRITCRDWFQLCLKEGLTVFRDQEFSSDQRSRPVKRIADVRALRATQFPEDAGPLAHNVRPATYLEINNFYTPTIYEKGAEVIRMLKMLIGPDAFRSGMDLYFERCDGTAATVEDFIACFAEASGRDLHQFMLWYNQAGTPQVRASGRYDASARTYALDLSQQTAPTPGQPEKKPLVIPVALGLIDAKGHSLALEVGDADGATAQELSRGVFDLTSGSRRIVFTNVDSKPAVSLFRGFSAPVRVDADFEDADLLTLLAYDTDMFNRWQAVQTYATRLIIRAVDVLRSGGTAPASDAFARALGRIVSDRHADPAFAALALTLPTEADISREIAKDVDPDAVHVARKRLKHSISAALSSDLLSALAEAPPAGAGFSPDSASAGRRALHNALLDLYATASPETGADRALKQFRAADNMTDKIGALTALAQIPGEAREKALEEFYEAYAGDPLVIDKWFALQASLPESGAIERVERLMRHPAFSTSNPNRLRALIGSFTANLTQFHAADGSGYRLLARVAGELDDRNPQVASRLLAAFRTWRSMEAGRRIHAEAALREVAGRPNLSPDVRDIVDRSLA